MRKLFISQPMNGLSNEEIEATRKRIVDGLNGMEIKSDETGEVIDTLKSDEIEIIDSFFKDAPHDAKPLWFLGKSFELLSTADIAYFGKGWDTARGCKMEHEAAVQYKIPLVITE